MLRLPGASIRTSSQGLNWQSMYVSLQEEKPFRGAFIAKDPLLVLHRKSVSGYANLEQVGHGMAPAGSLRFVAPGEPFDVELTTATETIHLYLRREIWDEMAMDMTGGTSTSVAFRSGLVVSEPLLFALSEAAVAAADARNTDLTFSDHLSRCIASHIMSTHLGIRHKQRRMSDGGRLLSREVARAIDFMEANADRSISLDEIASAACRSPSHLARVFSAEIGMPPHRYLISLRVNRARNLLARTNRPIAEIALDCGFTHQEHLTRLFRKHFETTPAAFRRVYKP